ncbi:MAG TPA: hypothetical protein VGL26_00990 [Jatrophihabitans sp.]
MARAAREAQTAAERDARQQERERQAASRARQESRSRLWRRVRIWQRMPSSRRRDTGKLLGATVLVVLVLAYTFTRSVKVVVGVAFILLIASPVLIKFSFDRGRR